jgi:hypothetical protein
MSSTLTPNNNNNTTNTETNEESIMSLSYWTARPFLALGIVILVILLVLFLILKYTKLLKGTFIDTWWHKIQGWFTKSGSSSTTTS